MVKILISIWWRGEIGHKKQKVHNINIYNTTVKNILTYGYEEWRLTDKEKRGIVLVEMDALRRSCGISRRDSVRNAMIRRKVKISETIEEEIQSR